METTNPFQKGKKLTKFQEEIDRKKRKIKREYKRSSLQSNKGKGKARTAPSACKPLEGAAPWSWRGHPTGIHELAALPFTFFPASL